MGNYQICDFCGNLSEKTSRKMCKSCEDAYLKIRSIVEVYPDTMVIDISKQTGISASKILAFARNGYFVLKEGTIEGLE
ncbi:hypothetical protein SAMN04488542_103159 [Fontibacillus panacisegetis]|uniref:Flagellar operon protein TIGR03826 n=1 Tax=Fontibacillus panacisegetis TaxID=670482 RepID=A0A1G7GQP8_9BACL|nr:hypothetical protein [Fontibacillus panacisegetis]SDE90480.1 hypothetical protein SAMN04488542_103159 [Fontibacillus panacisegetis]